MTNRTTKARLAQLEEEVARRVPTEPITVCFVWEWPPEAPLRGEDEGVTWVRDWRDEPYIKLKWPEDEDAT